MMQGPQNGGNVPVRATEEIYSRAKKLERFQVTENEQAAEAYRSLVDHSLQGLAIFQERRVVFANQAMAKITGYTVDEILAMSPDEVRTFVHPGDRGMVWERHRQRLQGELPVERYELRGIRKDGSVRWLEIEACLVEYQGKPAIQAACVDVTSRRRAEETLRESEDQLKRAQEVAHVGSWHLDLRTDRLTWSEETYRIFGVPIGQPLKEVDCLAMVHPDDVAYVKESWATALQGGPCDIEHRIVTAGTVKWVREKAQLEFDAKGSPVLVIGTVQDVTERKRAEEDSQRQATVLYGINKVLTEALTGRTDREVARTCLAIAEELTGSKFGYIGELNEQGLFDTIAISDPGWDACQIPGSDAVQLIKDMPIRGIDRATLRQRRSRIVNDPASHPDRVGLPKGHPPIISFLGVPLKYGGRTMGMIGLGNKESGYSSADRQIVETLSVSFVEALMYKRVENRLLAYQAKLRTMASEILQTQERERQRLAVGLHDNLSQKLVLTKLTLESSLRSITDARVASSLRTAIETVGEVINEAESLTFELGNPVLSELGFVPAVGRYLSLEIRRKHGITFDLDADKKLGPLQDDIKTCLFRVTRELLTNVVKHAAAQKVWVSVHKIQGKIHVTVRDNGVGFKSCEVDGQTFGNVRFGLFSVREQLEHLGGRLILESKPDRGTVATVIV